MYLRTFLSISVLMLSQAYSAGASPIDDASKYSVRIKSTVQYAFAEEDAGTSNGAGFLVDKQRGWVLTNAHVSGYGTGDLEVSFKGFDYFEATPVYVDPELDFAVVKVDAENIPKDAKEARLDCGDRSLNGLAVAAYGHPHNLSYSASRGIISQVRYYDGLDWVQTDAAINPGNSGGPLIELDTGDVVGINAMGLKDAEGLNFAVPSKPICKILDLMRAGKDPSPPELPMSFAVNDESEEYLIVGTVIEGGGLTGGILTGDRVFKIDGEPVSTPTQLRTQLRGKTGEVLVAVKRGDRQFVARMDVKPQAKILDRKYVLADGALIAQDAYPERWSKEGFFHVHSVRNGSYAERSGWMMQWSDFAFYFAGDAGYSSDFKETVKKLGSPDLAAIPIGAYEPREFMKSAHINPEEAVKVFSDLGAKYAIGIHWGTFKLTLEPMNEPPIRLKNVLKAAGVDSKNFRTLKHGEIWPEVLPN